MATDRAPRGLLVRLTAPLLAVAASSWIVALVSLEWSFPYCLSQEDGPATAVYGFPLPYTRMSLVSSAVDDFMPHVYLLNVAIVATALLFAARTLRVRPPRRPALTATVAAALLGVQVLLQGAALASGFLNPTMSIGDSSYGLYSELRPVSVGILRINYECTPSRWWFPGGWQHK